MSGGNNSTDITNCNGEPVVQSIMFFVDNIETPIYFIVGMFSRLISLLSVYKETKTEKAYLFQIYLLLAELCEILFEFVSRLSMKLRVEAHWFQRCYACMFWDRRLVNVFAYATKMITNILTLAMCVDQTYALKEPIKYNMNRNVTRIRKLLPFVTVLIGFATCIPFAFLFDIELDPEDGVYIQIPTNKELAYTQLFVSGVLDLLLIISNIVANARLCYIFQKVMNRRAMIKRTSSLSATTDSSEDRTKTLFKMTFCQSLCNTFASLISIVHRMGVPLIGAFSSSAVLHMAYCFGGPVVAAATELMDIVEFFLMSAISKKFRSMVIETMKNIMCAKMKKNQVRTIDGSKFIVQYVLRKIKA